MKISFTLKRQAPKVLTRFPLIAANTAATTRRIAGDTRTASCAQRCWLPPVMMMRTPISVSAVESVRAVNAEPRPVQAIGRVDDDADRRRRSVVNRARRRRVIVSWRGSAVRFNHFGAGVRAQSRPKPECEHHQCHHNNFLFHDRISLLLFGRLNPTVTAKLLNNRRLSWNSSSELGLSDSPIHCQCFPACPVHCRCNDAKERFDQSPALESPGPGR